MAIPRCGLIAAVWIIAALAPVALRGESKYLDIRFVTPVLLAPFLELTPSGDFPPHDARLCRSSRHGDNGDPGHRFFSITVQKVTAFPESVGTPRPPPSWDF